MRCLKHNINKKVTVEQNICSFQLFLVQTFIAVMY